MRRCNQAHDRVFVGRKNTWVTIMYICNVSRTMHIEFLIKKSACDQPHLHMAFLAGGSNRKPWGLTLGAAERTRSRDTNGLMMPGLMIWAHLSAWATETDWEQRAGESWTRVTSSKPDTELRSGENRERQETGICLVLTSAVQASQMSPGPVTCIRSYI